MRHVPLWLLALVGCTPDSGGPQVENDTDTDADTDADADTDTDADSDADTDTDGCYPSGAVEPMALGEVLSPYSWPVAKHRDGVREAALALSPVPCAADAVIDWSPFDVLLFVSIPAW